MSRLTEQELAGRAGTSVGRIRSMCELRLLNPVNGLYDPSDIQLVRVAEAFDRTGLPLRSLRALIEGGHYSTSWAPKLFPDPIPSSGKTLAQLADECGISEEDAARILSESWRLPVPGPDEEVREDDAELVRLGAIGAAAMGPEAIESSRYFGENLRRVTEAQYAFFRAHVEEPIFESSPSVQQAIDTIVELVVSLAAVGPRVVDLLYRRHLETQFMTDIVLNIELAMQEAGVARERIAKLPTIAFFDLTASSEITERRGDQAAIDLASGLVRLSQEAERHDGRVVKFLGDGGMLHFADAANAVRAGLAMVARAPALDLPPTRLGAHSGPVIPRDGDFFGRTVIVASRVADRADPSSVVVTGDVVSSIGDADDLAFESGPVAELKGISEPVPLFRARWTH